MNFATIQYVLKKNKELKDIIPSKTSELTNDSGFIASKDIPETQVPDLSGYAKTSEIPKNTSQLNNDSGFLTSHQDISGKANKSDAETWTFTLEDGSTVTKKVVLAP